MEEGLKRGQTVSVTFEAIVLNRVDGGYRVTVKNPLQPSAFWAVVPENTVKEK